MSFDHLQKRIKRLKNPLAVCLSPTLDQIPPAVCEEAFAAFGETPEGAAQALLRFDLDLMNALQDTVPALWVQIAPFLALGWQGMKALEDVLRSAKEKGFFVIADLPLLEAEAASLTAGTFLGSQPQGARPALDADCVLLNGYPGSDGIRPVLELCRREDKCCFVQVRTPNPSAAELQDLVAGDRVTHQALGDLVQRMGREEEAAGYTRAGAAVGLPYPSDLRALRTRLEQTFLLVTNFGRDLTAEDVRFAFDPYGRGALLSDGGTCMTAWQTEAEAGFAQAAQAAAQALGTEIRQFVTFL